MPAVQAYPPRLHVADKQLVLPQKFGKPLEPLRMDFFDLRDLTEMPRDLRKSLLLRLLRESRINIAKLIHLMLPRQLQKLKGLVRQVDGIVGGDGDVLTPALLEMVVKDLRVLLLLSRGVGEDLLDRKSTRLNSSH